ncbi:MAG: hypothetical protein ACXADB_05605 [Candidatus Hermodarchaeia archaeon]|jgi:hypothetical protein
MNIEELANWSGWRPEDKLWIENIVACSRTIADKAIRDHILNIMQKVKQQRIAAAAKGGSAGYGGFIGYE